MADTNRGTTPASTISLAITNRLKNLHTMLPAEIVTFDPATQLAEVQPSIDRIINGSDVIRIPKIINVPVIFPRAGGFSLTFPVAPGDSCILWFCERSLDNWIRDGAGFKPNDIRFHNISDAVALAGLNSQQNNITGFNATNVQLRNDTGDSYIEIDDSKNINLSTPANITANAGGSMTITAPTVTINGNLVVTGTSTASDHMSDTVSGKTHVHINTKPGDPGEKSGIPEV